MLYIDLFNEYISTMAAANPSLEKEVRDAITDGSTMAKNVKWETKAALVISHDKILQAKTLQILNSLHFLKYQKNKWIKKPSKVFDGLYDNFRNFASFAKRC